MKMLEDDEDEEQIPDLIEIPGENGKIIPVTILSGFLGSGKTTLLNYILTASHGKRIAVIENEFSAGLGVEGMIAKSGVNGQSLAGFFELNNGCVSR
jgi:G3E family GTPase